MRGSTDRSARAAARSRRATSSRALASASSMRSMTLPFSTRTPSRCGRKATRPPTSGESWARCRALIVPARELVTVCSTRPRLTAATRTGTGEGANNVDFSTRTASTTSLRVTAGLGRPAPSLLCGTGVRASLGAAAPSGSALSRLPDAPRGSSSTRSLGCKQCRGVRLDGVPSPRLEGRVEAYAASHSLQEPTPVAALHAPQSRRGRQRPLRAAVTSKAGSLHLQTRHQTGSIQERRLE